MFLLARLCLMSFSAIAIATVSNPFEGSVEYFKVASKSSIRFEDKVELKHRDPTEVHRLSEIRCSYGSRINSFEAVYDAICNGHFRWGRNMGTRTNRRNTNEAAW